MVPEITSISPDVACGAIDLVSDGFRRSPSIRMVLAPACALSSPSEAATVDFPSLGSAEDRPTTRPVRDAPLRSIATLIERMPSVKRENGSFTTAQNAPELVLIIRG